MISICKYLVFAGDKYYPQGGWGDYESSYDGYEDARSAALALTGLGDPTNLDNSDWSHVVDMATGKIVFQVSAQDKIQANGPTMTGGKRVRELHCVAWDSQGNMQQSLLTL